MNRFGRWLGLCVSIGVVGDVVTAKGTLHKDKDFGAGYKYRAIVEEATVKR